MTEQPPFISQTLKFILTDNPPSGYPVDDWVNKGAVLFHSMGSQINISLPKKFRSNIDKIQIDEKIKELGIECGGGAHSVIIISDMYNRKYYLICGEGYINNSFEKRDKGRMQGGPGGAKEAGQGYITTIKKEMIEEIGIDLDDTKLKKTNIRIIKCDVKLTKDQTRNDFVIIGGIELKKPDPTSDSPDIKDFPNRVETDVHVDYLITFKVDLDFDKIEDADELINAIFSNYETDYEIQYLLLLEYERPHKSEEAKTDSPFDNFCKSKVGDNHFKYKLFVDKEKNIKSINGTGKIQVVDTEEKNKKNEPVLDYTLHIHGNKSEDLTPQPEYRFLEGRKPIFRDFVKPREFVDAALRDLQKLTHFTIKLKTLGDEGQVISDENILETDIKFIEKYLDNEKEILIGGKKSKKVKKFIKTKKRITKKRRHTKRRR